MATIEIARSSEWANRLRNIRIFIDDKQVGIISNGKTESFEVSPGNHVLQAKIDWCTSNKMPFTISESGKKSYNLTSFAKHNPLGTLATIYYISFGKNKYLNISEQIS